MCFVTRERARHARCKRMETAKGFDPQKSPQLQTRKLDLPGKRGPARPPLSNSTKLIAIFSPESMDGFNANYVVPGDRRWVTEQEFMSSNGTWDDRSDTRKSGRV